MGLFSPSEPSLELVVHFLLKTDKAFGDANMERIDRALALEDKIYAKTATAEDRQQYKNSKGWQTVMVKAAEIRKALKEAGWTPPPDIEK